MQWEGGACKTAWTACLIAKVVRVHDDLPHRLQVHRRRHNSKARQVGYVQRSDQDSPAQARNRVGTAAEQLTAQETGSAAACSPQPGPRLGASSWVGRRSEAAWPSGWHASTCMDQKVRFPGSRSCCSRAEPAPGAPARGVPAGRAPVEGQVLGQALPAAVLAVDQMLHVGSADAELLQPGGIKHQRQRAPASTRLHVSPAVTGSRMCLALHSPCKLHVQQCEAAVRRAACRRAWERQRWQGLT